MLEVYREEFNMRMQQFPSIEFRLTKDVLKKVMLERALYGFNMMLLILPAVMARPDAETKETVELFADELKQHRMVQDSMENPTFIAYLKHYLVKFDRLGVFDVEFN